MVLGGRCLAKLTSEPLPNPSLKPKYLYIAVFCPPLERYVKVTERKNLRDTSQNLYSVRTLI
jgi:hypothetical protein